MTCEPCTYSPESVEDYSQTLSSDTRQSSLWSGMPTPAKSSENEPPKDGSPSCQCGKGMSDCSIHPSTRDEWIASMQDSLVRTLALLENRQVYLREPDQVFTEKSCVLLASLSQDSSFWKTCQQSFLMDSEPFLQTWPRWGMTADGVAYAHPMSERRITETGGSHFVPTPDTMNHRDGTNLRKDCNIKEGGMHGVSLHHWAAMFPTPTVTSGAQVAWDKTPGQTGGTTLAGYVKYWPTPTAHDAKDTGTAPSEGNMNTPNLAFQAGGKLNPNWVEWLMGFPIGFTASKDSVTRKYPCKPQLHGNSLEASN